MEAAVAWTAQGAVTQWPRASRRRSFPALAIDRPRGVAGMWHRLPAAVAHWWTKDLDDEGRDMTLLGAMMGLVAMAMVAATVWAQTTAIALPFERQLEAQHAEWARSQAEVATVVAEGITAP